VPLLAHVAPRGTANLHNVTAGPPLTGTFCNSDAPLKNPTHLPSGEKNG
jgi:hypothetical protein